MKRTKSIYFIVALLVITTFGIYGCSTNEAKEASIFSIPDFNNSTNIKPTEEQPVTSLQDLNQALVQIANEVTPSVVTIHIKETVKVQRPASPFRFFFGRPAQPFNQPQVRHVRALGSGVIVSENGYILTNNHVVQGADHIRVTLNNNESYVGKVVGRDPLTDIAVVKIDAHNLPAIEIGNSDSLKVGSLVMAVGSPEALANTVTFGIVSAKHRQIGLIQSNGILGYENYIQTDAAINPGNSGGALVNMNGELVGINGAIASSSGMYAGIGFAVPINLAKGVMKQIIKYGEVTHAMLGIVGDNINQAMAESFGLENNKGIIIEDVQNNSPADQAGLQQGDVIKTINGRPVRRYYDFRTAIATKRPGTEIVLGIVRNGNRMKIHVTLGKMKRESNQTTQPQPQNIHEQLGFQVHSLTKRIKRKLDIAPSQQGVVVTEVRRGSKAWRNELRERDIITHINHQKIEGIKDFRNVINDLANEEHPTILLQVINRQGLNQYIAFTL